MEWIKLTERLPDYYKPVIIFCDKNRHMCIAWMHTDGEELNFTIYGSNDVFMYDVTHWQPLPEEPK